jgi:PKD repeat protein
MKKGLLFILAIFVAVQVFSGGWRKQEMEVKVRIEKQTDLILLNRSTSNFDAPAGIPGFARAYVVPEEYNRLIFSGLQTEVIINDLNNYYSNFWDAKVPSGYYTYDQVIAIADSLAINFPLICQKIIIGTSVGNRQLAVLKISDNANVDENEAEIFFEAGIHGDEVGGTENVIRFARDICRGYATNTQYQNMINSHEIFLYLMVNPDGRISMSRYNDNAVDINRDGGYMWNGEGNSSAPFSQVETKAQRDFVYGNQFTVFTDYHSGTEFISYPWSYRPDATPDNLHINQLAGVYESSSGYINIPYAQGYSGMYPINGSTKDVNYGVMSSVSWSIEISNDKQPPASQIYSYYNKNKPAMIAITERCGYGISGTVTDSITGVAVPALIYINSYYPCYNDPIVGDYHKYLLAGSYTVKVVANGYKTKTVSNVVVPTNATAVANFQLAPESGNYGYKVAICYIPNNNLNDEGKTYAALGPPDYVNYSLGRNGYVIVDMKDTIFNGNGNDFKIFEGDGSPEGYSVYASLSMDGPWTLVADGTGSQEFDLPASVTNTRFLKIKDDGDGTSVIADAGFDLDALKILYTPVNAQFTASNNMPCLNEAVSFFDGSSGNPTSWNWTFAGGNPGVSTVKNPVGITYSSTGFYDVVLTVSDGTSSSTITQTAFIGVYGNPLAPSKPDGDSVLCKGGQTVEYATTGQANATAYQWQLLPPSAGTVSGTWTLGTVQLNPDFTGVAELSVMQITNCGQSSFCQPLTVEVLANPVVNLGADLVIPASQFVTLDAGNPGSSYLWNTGETTQTIVVDSSGIGVGSADFEVTVTNISGCYSSDNIIVTFSIDIGLVEQDQAVLSVYPNPASDYLMVSVLNMDIGASVFLLNAEGKCIQKSTLSQSDGTCGLNIKGVPHGVYLLRIASDKKMLNKKIVIH